MHRAMAFPALPFSVLAALLLAAEGTAQARLVGHVRDEQSGIPLEGARLTVTGPEGFRTDFRTDSSGSFSVPAPAGTLLLQASHPGYMPVTAPAFRAGAGEVVTLQLRLRVDAVVLAPLTVIARQRGGSPVLDNFHARAAAGFGHYLSRAEIERRGAANVSDLIVSIPGVRMTSSGRGNRPVAEFSRAGGRCRAVIFLDGVQMTRWPATGVSVNDLAQPAALEGIEVHPGSGSLPAEFRTAGIECGVIALWTRRGGPGAPS